MFRHFIVVRWLYDLSIRMKYCSSAFKKISWLITSLIISSMGCFYRGIHISQCIISIWNETLLSLIVHITSSTKVWSINTSHTVHTTASTALFINSSSSPPTPPLLSLSLSLSLLSVPLARCSVWAIQAKHHRIIPHSLRNTHTHTHSLFPTQCSGQEDLRSQISAPLPLLCTLMLRQVREDAKINEREGRRGGQGLTVQGAHVSLFS